MALAPESLNGTKGPSMMYTIECPWQIDMLPFIRDNQWMPGNYYFARKGKAKWKHKRKFR